VTFNILHGRSVVDGRVDVDRFAGTIRDLDPDVLALQEVDRDQQRSELADFTAVAADAMNAISHRFVAALAGTPGATWMAATGEEQPGSAAYGVALLSRYPATAWQTVRLPHIPFRFPMWLKTPHKIVMVSEEPRVCVAASIDTPLGTIAFANTHLSFVPGWNARQLRRLRRAFRDIPGRLVLMGDLNMEPARPETLTGYRSLAQHPTFPADTPNRQLDHLLLRGAALTVKDSRAVQQPLSDHRALVVEV
jgi:endonuclease/exonuclease/phosphatase family metal-dependent hydrolase